MTDEQINIAIAEQFPKLFIIRKPMHAPFQYYRQDACGYTNNIADAWKVSEDVARKHSCGSESDFDRVIYEPSPIPNYTADLNAIHEAVNSLSGGQYVNWVFALERICGFPLGYNATARQRCEAYLRTIWKWKDTDHA